MNPQRLHELARKPYKVCVRKLSQTCQDRVRPLTSFTRHLNKSSRFLQPCGCTIQRLHNIENVFLGGNDVLVLSIPEADRRSWFAFRLSHLGCSVLLTTSVMLYSLNPGAGGGPMGSCFCVSAHQLSCQTNHRRQCELPEVIAAWLADRRRSSGTRSSPAHFNCACISAISAFGHSIALVNCLIVISKSPSRTCTAKVASRGLLNL